jgi:hypothetical protein
MSDLDQFQDFEQAGGGVYHSWSHEVYLQVVLRSGGIGETSLSMMVDHRNQGKSPSIKVYECIQKFYKYLHKADPMATINPLYNEEEEDGHKFVPITESSSFPSNMLSLHNHIQICNPYTMSPENGNDDEGNPKL